MKKKALLASAIALVTASAMSFAPVSYKVIDSASAASAVPSKQEAVAKFGKVLGKIEADVKLSGPYNALLKQLHDDLNVLKQANNDSYLAQALESKNVDADAVQSALIELAQQLTADYQTDATGYTANKTNLSELAEQKLEALQVALGELGTDINRNSLISLLDSIEKQIIAAAKNFEYQDASKLEAFAEKAVKDAIKVEWNKTSEQNAIIATFVELYKSLNVPTTDVPEVAGEERSFTIFKADLDAAKAKLEAHIDGLSDADQVKSTYKHGAAALAIGYVQYYLEEVAKPLNASYRGKEVDLYPNLLGIKGFPLSALDWSVDNQEIATIGINDKGNLHLTIKKKGEVTVTAKLTKTDNVPVAFEGVALFSQTINVNPSSFDFGSGGGVISADLSLVSDYEAKAASIADAVAAYLEKNPELYNNTLTFGLKHLVEDIVREALLVQAAGAVTVQDGASSLNVSVDQMENIYSTQLNTVLNAVKAAFEAKGIELAIDPALTYNIGVTANGQVDVNKALIDSLLSKGISAVGVKTGDAVVEIALDQLTASSKVSIKKAASSVAGAKSDAYSISVTDGAGAQLTGFEKQYRVTLPVNGTGSNVTVAQVENGSLTYVGGQYDAASKTITFFTNQLGEFVVVENSASFNDIANIAWAKDQIQALADKGLLLGKGNGKFDPNGNVTRAEFTTMLVRAFNLNASTNLTFSDVSETAWYHDAISAAKAYGIVNGRSASIFDPNAKISREEMATMAANALKAVINYKPAADVDGILSQFVDGNQVVAVHRGSVALIKNEGIVQGKGKNNYDPKGDATRAEAAVILAKLLDRR